MNRIIDSKIDNKNIGLYKDLWTLRQALDVYCLISTNWRDIKSGGFSKFFFFLMMSCQHLISLCICKIFEKETDKQGKVRYELNSIDGILMSIADINPPILDVEKLNSFVRKYSNSCGENGTLLALSLVVEEFKTRYKNELERFKIFRDKRGAHSDFRFDPHDLPSYDVMERLFNFGLDFYMLVSKVFISVFPDDLNRDRRVKKSLVRMLRKLGFEEIKTEME